MTEFKDICNVLGGPNAVSRILGHKYSRAVRRACANNNPDPEWLLTLRNRLVSVITDLSVMRALNGLSEERMSIIKKNFNVTFNR